MKKKVIFVIISLLLISQVLAIPSTLKEVNGKTCGKYMSIGNENIIKIWYNRNWDCFCPISTKILIWLLDTTIEPNGMFRAYTCKELFLE